LGLQKNSKSHVTRNKELGQAKASSTDEIKVFVIMPNGSWNEIPSSTDVEDNRNDPSAYRTSPLAIYSVSGSPEMVSEATQ
jgi:hypothetical protein